MVKHQITSSQADFEKFEQRRRYPRIIMANTASLLFPGNQSVNVMLYDLSVCAIQMRFDSQTEQTIRSALQYLYDEELSTLQVRFRVKLHDKEEDVYVPCKPMYIYQLGQDIFAMGMQFADIENKYLDLIRAFVEVSMEPV